jgi:hypothetical protein
MSLSLSLTSYEGQDYWVGFIKFSEQFCGEHFCEFFVLLSCLALCRFNSAHKLD